MNIANIEFDYIIHEFVTLHSKRKFRFLLYLHIIQLIIIILYNSYIFIN